MGRKTKIVIYGKEMWKSFVVLTNKIGPFSGLGRCIRVCGGAGVRVGGGELGAQGQELGVELAGIEPVEVAAAVTHAGILAHIVQGGVEHFVHHGGGVQTLAHEHIVAALGLHHIADLSLGQGGQGGGIDTAQVGSSGGKGSGNRIAVLYAEGDIVDGEAPEREVGGETLAAKLADLRRDEEVKAVVLRVNSPGGSALASEVIWHEMELLRAEKPVVVSMGNVAASGGYYIACPADVILASPTTITGSIGVFGLLFNAGQGLKDKLGVTVDVAKTNPSADIGLPFREVSPAERDYLQHNVERVYAGFVKHVAEGRNLTEAQVDSIGGGRVWSGVSALDNGLIDAWGGLSDAISLAADRAGVGDDFSISVPSQAPDLFTRIFTLLSARAGVDHLQNGLGELYREYAGLQKILSRQGVQAVMPYRLEIR